MKKKILYYAIGGGAGHLSRCCKVVDFLNLSKSDITILGSSKHSEKISSGVQFIDVTGIEKENMHQFIEKTIRSNSFDQLIVDAFPTGIFGELAKCKINIPIIYIARLLNNRYLTKHPIPDNFIWSETLITETLTSKQIDIISKHSMSIRKFAYNPLTNQLKLPLTKKEKWIVVHSEPAEECEELCKFAEEIAEIENTQIQLFVFCLCEFSYKQAIIIKNTLAYQYFEDADRIITACGYNTMLECTEYTDKHMFIPFERKYDDQFLRATLKRADTEKRKKS